MNGKKNILLLSVIVFASIIFNGCSSAEEYDMPVVDQDYLDFVDDDFYEMQIGIIEKAAERMDEYVHYQNGQYIIVSCDADHLKLSHRLYDYMVTLMRQQNEELERSDNLYQMSEKSFMRIDSIPLTVSKLKTRSETGGGGINGAVVEVTWYATYVHIYISSNTLRYSSYLSGAAATIAAGCPDATASKAVALACGLGSLACTILKDEYPNGIIVSLIHPLHSAGCIPYSLQSQ